MPCNVDPDQNPNSKKNMSILGFLFKDKSAQFLDWPLRNHWEKDCKKNSTEIEYYEQLQYANSNIAKGFTAYSTMFFFKKK